MEVVFRAALGIGGSTLLGTACGFGLNRVTEVWKNIVAAFAAGVMLAAAAFGLFEPAMEMGNAYLLAAGAGCGVLFLRMLGALFGRIGRGELRRNPELMFVLAIALHKFPEGMAGGVGLNGANTAAAHAMVLGISLQNLPEGVVMIPPLLAAGMSRKRAAQIALLTGMLNAAGVFAGALWGRIVHGVLPFALAFAGGAMLDAIISQMLPRLSHSDGTRSAASAVLLGFVLMSCISML